MGDRIQAAIGYAVSPQGQGVAYAHVLGAPARQELLRLTFRVPPTLRSVDRSAAYAALTAVADELRLRGIRRVEFVVDQRELVDELTERRTLPETLVLPYVRLRCSLNAFSRSSVHAGKTEDLTQRARAEAALNLAA
jgi:hypothetical protein